MNADINWVCLMNNKIVVRELMTHICKKSSYVFIGNVIIGKNLYTLVDRETIDLVCPNLESKITIKKYQQIYKNLHDYIAKNPPHKTKMSVYFFGQASGYGQYLDVHWNACIYYPHLDRIDWFDPAVPYTETTLINHSIPNMISKIFGKQIYWTNCIFPPQQIIDTRNPNCDIFCQTWVMMYIDYRCKNKLEQFKNGNYKDNPIKKLKEWIKQLCLSHKEYKYYVNIDKYKCFFNING